MSIQRVFLVRHGETEWSLSGQHTGLTDIPLTDNGRAVARQLAPILEKVTFARVLTSPLHRARETCELAGLGERAEVDGDLAEWNYGDYEGLTPKGIHATSPRFQSLCGSMDRPSCRGRVSLSSRYCDAERSQLLPGPPRDQAVERAGRGGGSARELAAGKSINRSRAETLTSTAGRRNRGHYEHYEYH